MEEREAAAERERFYSTLGDMTRSTVESTQAFTETVERLIEKIEELNEVMSQSVECMVGFHQFLQFVADTYEEGEEPQMRDDLVSILRAFGQISSIFRKKRS